MAKDPVPRYPRPDPDTQEEDFLRWRCHYALPTQARDMPRVAAVDSDCKLCGKPALDH
jgi:hypothetical protein